LLNRTDIKALWQGDTEYTDQELDQEAEKIWRDSDVRNYISSAIEEHYESLQPEKMPL
jgi:hypothetical protein